MAMALDRRAPTGWAGLMIGLAVGCEIMVIGPISNGSINPARTLSPYVATSIFGGSTPWHQYWIYVVGPLAGAVIGVLLYDLIATPRQVGEPTLEPVTPAEPEGREGRAGPI